ncbi:MAG: transcriptional regulator, partial [Acidimicrobiales bacterium]
MSLQEVESTSGQEFKASVLGAYERGERVISVPRLQRLAGLYNVPVDQLLPQGADAVLAEVDDEGDGEPAGRGRSAGVGEKVTFDLTRLDDVADPDVEMVCRYLNSIVVQRQDFNGRVLTIRGEDIRAIAGLFGMQPADLIRRLDSQRLRLP